jgi:hypothetical protein
MTMHLGTTRRMGAILIALMMTTAVLLTTATTASAAIVPTVPLGTSANYAVLGASTVTNTGNSILDGSLGLFPGTSITGFPPGRVLPPGTTDKTNAAALQAQSDLTVAYVNAAGRPRDATTPPDLTNLKLGAGVYTGPSKSPLSLTGPLVLDGAGDPRSVFIFQTNSTLITGSGSTVTLINGAQECNVFWQVGSSATLGTSSVFRGNILALTSITVNNSVTVHGRALADNAAVTLINDTFTKPTCNLSPSTSSTGGSDSTTTGAGGGTGTGTGTTGGGAGTTATGTGTGTGTGIGTTGGGTGTGTTGNGTGTGTPGGGTGTTGTGTGTTGPDGDTSQTLTRGPGVPGVVGPPRTGAAPLPTEPFPWLTVLFVSLFGGAEMVGAARRRRLHARYALAER